MSIPTHPAKSGTFLVTSATQDRRRFFQVTAKADLMVETLQHYRRAGHYLLHAFVVMPEHIHLLITPQGAAIERVVGLIKGGSSRRLQSKMQVWQRGFDDRRLRDKEEFLAAREYIHQNPVAKGYCADAADWKWSSAWRGPGADA